MYSIDRAATRIGGDGRKQRRVGDAKADFLALHVSARLESTGTLVNSVQERVASCFAQISRRNTAQEENRHRRPDRPAVALRSGHSPQGVSETCRDGEDRQPLQPGAKSSE